MPTHLIVIHLFVYLSHCSISCCPKRKGFFCSCISHLVKSEKTPSNDVMLILPNEIKEKKYMKSREKEKINKEETNITASVGSEEKKVENLGTRLRRRQQSFLN